MLRGPTLPFRACPGYRLLGSPAVPRTLWANLLAEVGLPNLAGGFGIGVAMDGRGPGVMSLRTGDSGRGNDGRIFLPSGLWARPGPTDWLNFGSPGLGDVKFVEFWLATFNPPLAGVTGNALPGIEGESRLAALDRGRKMPAPG